MKYDVTDMSHAECEALARALVDKCGPKILEFAEPDDGDFGETEYRGNGVFVRSSKWKDSV